MQTVRSRFLRVDILSVDITSNRTAFIDGSFFDFGTIWQLVQTLMCSVTVCLQNGAVFSFAASCFQDFIYICCVVSL